ncbi:MAG: hypothetical protein IIA61_10675 [Candidatus Marinimicrobia bacterium]|nr:hypothetical protein [Candidatus Neomarinimicrobiota bacterium]
MTTVRFDLPAWAEVTITIYDILGWHVETLVSSWRVAGNHRVEWDAGYLASGFYFYRLENSTLIKIPSRDFFKTTYFMDLEWN